MPSLLRFPFAVAITALLFSMTTLADNAPQAAPDFTLKATDGKNVRLSDLKGKVVMVNFWASWCGPCLQEMPHLEKIYTDYKDAGFILLGVNVDADNEERDAFLKDAKLSFPILDDSDNVVSELFAVDAMPSSYFIDQDGKLVHAHRGYRPGEEQDYIAQIKKLLAQ